VPILWPKSDEIRGLGMKRLEQTSLHWDDFGDSLVVIIAEQPDLIY
jgi:hypothetical protein